MDAFTEGTGAETGGPAHQGAGAPHFDIPVAANGYAWWYVDAIADDGEYALTIIAFVGSVFSPYYAWARRRGPADPENHVNLNVALYGPRKARWAMTERGRGALSRDRDSLTIGPSAVAWRDGGLVIDIAETAVPLPRPVRGRVTVTPEVAVDRGFVLDGGGRHIWHPLAPRAHVEVAMTDPDLRWTGTGYFDTNTGSEPLEAGFRTWTWSRAPHGPGATVLYDADRRDGTHQSLALAFEADGRVTPFDAPGWHALPGTLWGVDRHTRSAAEHPPSVVSTLEAAPFYTRSAIRSAPHGTLTTGIHESLDLDRFTMPVVQAMLPFRMPRRGG